MLGFRFQFQSLVLLIGLLIYFDPANADPTDPPAHFQLINDTRQSAAPQILTFGQVFKVGEVKADGNYQYQIDGVSYPLQMNVKALHDDGSVRHALLTIETPALSAQKKFDAQIVAVATPMATQFMSPNLPDLKVRVDIKDSPAGPGMHAVSLSEVTLRGTKIGGPWIDGALAREQRYAYAITDQIEIIFDVWQASDGRARVDVIFHNDWAGSSELDFVTYDVAIDVGGSLAYQATNIKHNPFSNWHKLIWVDNKPTVRVRPYLAQLIGAGAVPRYDQANAPTTGLMNQLAAYMAAAEKGPLGSGFVQQYMPTTGGRWDIGLLPTWAVIYLLDGSTLAEEALFLNADVSGAVPWHIRNRSTRLPLSLDEYPNLWLDYRGPTIPGIVEEPFNNQRFDWAIDDAHQPSLTYLPYLLTGLRYYKDELRNQAAYNLLYYWPAHRGDGLGLFVGATPDTMIEARGMAWSLRTLANAAFILPADDPMKEYLSRKLNDNLSAFNARFVSGREMAAAGEVEGWIPAYFDDGETSPWQHAFLASAFDWTHAMGFETAGTSLEWLSGFLTGLFINEDNGFDPNHGAAYTLFVANPETGVPYATWKTVFDKTKRTELPQDEVDTEWSWYGAIMRAAVAGSLSVTNSPEAAKAFGFVAWKTWNLRFDAGDDPTFGIVPQRPDGTLISYNNIKSGTARDNNYEGSSGAEIYYGRAGDDQIMLAGGDDIAFGGIGNDRIDAGAGNDQLFGDVGDDLLVCDIGKNICEGGAGADGFEFTNTERFEARVLDFDPATDHINLSQGLTDIGFTLTPVDGVMQIHFTNGSRIALDGAQSEASVRAKIKTISN